MSQTVPSRGPQDLDPWFGFLYSILDRLAPLMAGEGRGLTYGNYAAAEAIGAHHPQTCVEYGDIARILALTLSCIAAAASANAPDLTATQRLRFLSKAESLSRSVDQAERGMMSRRKMFRDAGLVGKQGIMVGPPASRTGRYAPLPPDDPASAAAQGDIYAAFARAALAKGASMPRDAAAETESGSAVAARSAAPQATPGPAVSAAAVPPQAAPGPAATAKAAAPRATPGPTVPAKAAPPQATPGQAVSDTPVPPQAAPGPTAPAKAMAPQAAPAPSMSAASQAMPGPNAPAKAAPLQAAPGPTALAEAVPPQAAPAPARSAASQAMPGPTAAAAPRFTPPQASQEPGAPAGSVFRQGMPPPPAWAKATPPDATPLSAAPAMTAQPRAAPRQTLPAAAPPTQASPGHPAPVHPSAPGAALNALASAMRHALESGAVLPDVDRHLAKIVFPSTAAPPNRPGDTQRRGGSFRDGLLSGSAIGAEAPGGAGAG